MFLGVATLSSVSGNYNFLFLYITLVWIKCELYILNCLFILILSVFISHYVGMISAVSTYVSF